MVRWTTKINIIISTEAIFTYRVDETFDLGLFCFLPYKLMWLFAVVIHLCVRRFFFVLMRKKRVPEL